MKIKDLKIGRQLLISYTLLLLFVLGAETYWQSHQLHEQTVTLYDHPLQVRRALDNLKSETLNMSLNMRNLILAESEKEESKAIPEIEWSEASAESVIWGQRKMLMKHIVLICYGKLL